MTVFQHTLSAEQLAGLAFARANANAEMPATVTVDGAEVPNPALHATDLAYLTARINDVLNSYAKQKAESAVVAPAAPATINGVPQEVTRRQALQALLAAGLLDDVEAKIAAIPDPVAKRMTEIEWNESQTFQRHRPLVVQLGTAIGLTSEGIDALFIDAASR